MGLREYIEHTPAFDRWPELSTDLLQSMAGEPDWKLSLPLLACEAVGGDPNSALPAVAAWLCMRHAAPLMDSATDLGEGTANQIGMSAALIFAGFLMICDLADDTATQRVMKEFSNAGLHSAVGQSLFISPMNLEQPQKNPLEQYWQAVILKSGSIFQAGAAGGAASASKRQDWITSLGEYGSALGVMLQVLDDCRDRKVDQLKRSPLQGLPALLQDLLPGAGEQALPEVVSQILSEWRRRALLSLSDLPNSTALDILRHIPDDILNLVNNA